MVPPLRDGNLRRRSGRDDRLGIDPQSDLKVGHYSDC